MKSSPHATVSMWLLWSSNHHAATEVSAWIHNMARKHHERNSLFPLSHLVYHVWCSLIKWKHSRWPVFVCLFYREASIALFESAWNYLDAKTPQFILYFTSCHSFSAQISNLIAFGTFAILSSMTCQRRRIIFWMQVWRRERLPRSVSLRKWNALQILLISTQPKRGLLVQPWARIISEDIALLFHTLKRWLWVMAVSSSLNTFLWIIASKPTEI